MDLFIELCKEGKINELEKYYSEHLPINIHADTEDAFGLSCKNNKLDTTKWLYLLDRRNFDINVINNNYDYIKNNKSLTRLIACDYKNNSWIKKEYTKEYNKWKLRIIIKTSGKLMKFYNYIMEKSYSPKGIGYLRAHDDFNNKTNL